MRTVQYIPRATEKAYVAQTQNTYIFYVPKGASKQEIAKKIAEEFKVTVIDVRAGVRKGKPTRFSRGKHAYPGITNRRDRKVAYVTLKAGDKIPVFEEPAKAEDTKKTAKTEKKADKTTEKTEKKVAKKTTKTTTKVAKEDK